MICLKESIYIKGGGMNTCFDLSSFEQKPSISFKSTISKIKDNLAPFLNYETDSYRKNLHDVSKIKKNIFYNYDSSYFSDELSVFLSKDLEVNEKYSSDIDYNRSLHPFIKESDFLLEKQKSKYLESIETSSKVIFSSTTSRRVSPTNIAIGRIRTLSLLEDGWNGLGSVAAKKETLLEAEDLVRLMFENTIREPTISLASDGEINFYWNFNKNILDLGVFGDGYYSYYFCSNEGKEIFADDKPIKSIINDEILNIIVV